MSYNFLRLPQVQHFRDAAFLACRRQPTPPPFGIDWKIEAKRVKARVTIPPLNGFIGLRCQCENYMTLGLLACPAVPISSNISHLWQRSTAILKML